MTAPRLVFLEATGRPNFPEACASSCSVAQTCSCTQCVFTPAHVFLQALCIVCACSKRATSVKKMSDDVFRAKCCARRAR